MGPAGPEGGMASWQPDAAWERLADLRRLSRLFGYHRIECAWEVPEGVANFIVYVHDQQPREIYASMPGYGKRHFVPSHSKKARRVALLAMRAAHIVGLDSALVYLVINNGRLAISRLEPGPAIDTAAQRAPLRGYEQGKTVTLGADPEFVLVAPSGLVAADRVFPLEGGIGCDAFRDRMTGEHPLAELRPAPAANPAELVEHIRVLLTKAQRRMPWRSVRWLSGSMPWPGIMAGGHVHFGMAPNAQLVRALDNYLAVPLLLIEDRERAIIRRARYGFLGEIRLKPHGFEYRTLSSWLWSPRVTFGVMALARVIADNHEKLSQNVFADDSAHAAFYAGDTRYFTRFLPQLHHDVLSLATPHDAAVIETLFEMAAAGCAGEDEDIMEAWKIPQKRVWPMTGTQQAQGPAAIYFG